VCERGEGENQRLGRGDLENFDLSGGDWVCVVISKAYID